MLAVTDQRDYTQNVVPIRVVTDNYDNRGYKLLDIVRCMKAGTWYKCSDGVNRYRPVNL